MTMSLRSRGANSPSKSADSSPKAGRRSPSKSPSKSANVSPKISPKLHASRSPVAAGEVTLLADEKTPTKWGGFWKRFFPTWIMIFSFVAVVVYLQQLGCSFLVFFLQAGCYKELVKLSYRWENEKQLPHQMFLYIYWFCLCTFTSYGRTLKPHLLMHRWDEYFGGFKFSDIFIAQHSAISFAFYMIGLVVFVISLKRKKHYKYQFVQFAWCHMALILINVQSTFMIANMFEGLIWFLLPVALVVTNDVMAYVFGFLFGKTPLLRISPKKTWEGFIGAAVSTIVAAWFLAGFLAQYELMVCPKKGFSFEYVSCRPDAIYVAKPLREYEQVAMVLPERFQHVRMAPIQLFAVPLGAFASLLAPFGGFFASGLKRAFKIKDFGDSIPGHGGFVDRFDCHIIMGIFSYVYINSFLGRGHVGTVEGVLDIFATLKPEQRMVLYKKLEGLLVTDGLLPGT